MNEASDAAIVIVDDDEAVRHSLSAVLETEHWRVKTFPSGDAALAGLDAGDVGCLVVDVRMPGMDGLELQRQLRARGIDTPVVIITGHGDVPLAVQAMREGAFDFIEKPFDNSILITSIRAALKSRRHSAFDKKHSDEAVRRFNRLTAREREVLELLVTGQANKQIAHALNISVRTVEIHRARVMEKTATRNISQLVRLALAAGIEPKQT
jgi:two-component system response regulator FixJ